MVILVSESDECVGYMEKIEAHEKALLHRAFSVLIFNSNNELLLQQRAFHKYHTPGKWTNTCCSHPQKGETTMNAANRRLMEEMGLAVDLRFLFKFTYKAAFDNTLTEHEIDHVFIGCSDEAPKINKDEVNDFKYMSIENILEDIRIHPDNYTPWFKIILGEYYARIENKLK